MLLEGPSGHREARGRRHRRDRVRRRPDGGDVAGDDAPRSTGSTADSELAIKAALRRRSATRSRQPVEKIVDADYPNLAVLSNDELKSRRRGPAQPDLRVFNALVGVAIFASLFGIINTLSMSVIERTREIGVLRALGSTRWQIRRTIADESLVIALIGAVMGIAIGAGLGWALLKGLSFGIPGVTYTPPVATMVGVAIAAVVLGLIAAILPARRAARLDVVDALSYE